MVQSLSDAPQFCRLVQSQPLTLPSSTICIWPLFCQLFCSSSSSSLGPHIALGIPFPVSWNFKFTTLFRCPPRGVLISSPYPFRCFTRSSHRRQMCVTWLRLTSFRLWEGSWKTKCLPLTLAVLPTCPSTFLWWEFNCMLWIPSSNGSSHWRNIAQNNGAEDSERSGAPWKNHTGNSLYYGDLLIVGRVLWLGDRARDATPLQLHIFLIRVLSYMVQDNVLRAFQ